MARDSIIIVGAGIIGLDVALVLADKGLGRSVTVIAEYLPGDTAPSYTSPWAGCNYSSVSGSDTNALRWDRLGYTHLLRLASECPDEAFVRRTPSVEIWDDAVPQDKIHNMAAYLEDFSAVPSNKLPPGASFAISFTTVTVHAPRHLLWLYNRLCKAGVTFMRRRLLDLTQAYGSPSTSVVFNCTGNAARVLPGVADPTCYPTRGQVVLVHAPAVKTNMMRYGQGYLTYIIPRPGSEYAILGGYMQKGNHDYATYASETESILARTKSLSAELRGVEPEVLSVATGLRPSREGGARVERCEILVSGRPRVLVHNYGAGGTGYQAGYGMALDAVASVEGILPSTKSVF